MRKWYFLIMLAFVFIVQAQIAGVRNIPSANYPTIASAFDSLNTYGVGIGGVTFIVQGGYVESITSGLQLNATGTADSPIEFRWDGTGTKPKLQRTDLGTINTSTIGGYGDAVIQLNGTDYFSWKEIDIYAFSQEIEYGILTHKPDGTNGCQNILIQGSKINMIKGTSGYVIGIYIGNGTTNPGSATGVTVTVPSGKNKNIFLIQDTILQTHAGIYVRGYNNTNLCDSAITIDQCDVSFFGGGNVSSAYGIYFIYVKDITISNNNIVSSNHNSTLYGIFFSSGTLGNLTVHNNYITLNNTSASSTTNYIYNGNTVTSETYTGNRFWGNNITSTGTVYFIYSSNATLNKNILNNQINFLNRTATSGTVYGYYNLGSPTSGWENIINNAFHNITLAGSSSFYGIYTYTSAGHNHLVRHNFFNSITTGTGTSYLINVRSGSSAIIDSTTTYAINAAGMLYGIYANGITNVNIEKNLVLNLLTTGTSIYGIAVEGSGNFIINRNYVRKIQSDNAMPGVVGIYANGGNSIIHNNFITELYAPNTNNVANAIRGIDISSSAVSAKLYYNTIYLDANAPSATTFGTSAINANTTPTVELINNIVINNSSSAGSGTSVAFRRSSTNINTYSTVSNNNIFYVNNISPNNYFYSDGTNNFNDFNNFVLFVAPRESMSQTELTPFVNISVSPYDLHVNTNVPTYADEGGVAIPSITTDFDGQTRDSQTPDIGADEFTGIPIYSCTTPAPGNTMVTDDSICYGQSVTLSITPTSGTGVVYIWQKSTDGINFVDISGNTPSIQVTPDEPAYYRCKAICKAGPDTVISIPVFVDFAYKVLSYTSGTVCGEQSINLSATGTPGSSFNWFNAPTGGVILGSDSVFATPPISSDTNFYVSAWGPNPGNVVLGTGSLNSTSFESPFYHLYGGLKSQFLIRASELQAAGLTSGNINALSFEVISVGTTYQDFTLSLGATSQNVMTTTFVSGLQTVYTTPAFTPVVGMNTITFTNPFYWDGISNLVIEFCWSNNNSGGSSTHVKYDNTPYIAESYYRADNQPASSLCAVTSTSGTLSRRPMFILNGLSYCYSPRVEVPVTYVSAPDVNIVSVDTLCAGQNLTLQAISGNAGYSYLWLPDSVYGGTVVVNPYFSTTYTVVAEDSSGGSHNGCKTHTNKFVTVGNIFPVVDSVIASASQVCEGTPVDLFAYYRSFYNRLDTIFTESFESASLPAGWDAQLDVDGNGTNAAFTYETNSVHPAGFTAPHGNYFVRFNSWSISSGNKARLITPLISTQNYSNLHVRFYWTKDIGFVTDSDRVFVQYSFDKNTWFTVDSIIRNGTSNQWVNVDFALPLSVNDTGIYIGFLFVSDYGNDCHLDYVRVYGETPDDFPVASIYWTSSPSMTLPANDTVYNVQINQTTTFNFHVKNIYYCEATDSVQVTAIPYPVVDLPSSVTSPITDDVELDAGNPGATYQWFVDNNLAGNSQAITLTSTTADTLHVKVIVTNAGMCSSSDSTIVIFFIPSGFDETAFILRVYPNPASENIYLQFEQIEPGNYQLAIVSLNGDVVYLTSVIFEGAPIRLNVSSYPAGQYYINLSGNGRQIRVPLVIVR